MRSPHLYTYIVKVITPLATYIQKQGQIEKMDIGAWGNDDHN